MTPRKKPEELLPTGRPTDYQPRFNKTVRSLALLGATDVEMAEALGIATSTFYLWKQTFPAFSEALKQGKDEADARVAQSLYHRAIGYSHPAVKIITVPRGGNQGSDIEQVEYTERYPPDTTAAIFWLKNRRKNEWRDRSEVDHTVTVSVADKLTEARQRALQRGVIDVDAKLLDSGEVAP